MFRKLLAIVFCFCMFSIFLPQKISAEETLISAKSYILVEAVTGRVLDAKNEHLKLPVASTTKILTALIALEQFDITTYFPVNTQAIKVEGTSLGLRSGDSANLYCLAAGMLLASGNDAANAAAVKISSSIDKFADLMNKRGAEIGMYDSHFVSPSGLHDEEHYSTAFDMALLTRYALQNEKFAEICKQSSMKLSFGNPCYSRLIKNHNRLLKSYEGCVGVKTGFTKKAGRCLVSAAQRDGLKLICVTLNDPNDWSDHEKLLDFGFANAEKIPITVSVDDICLNVVGGVKKNFNVKSLSPTYAYITKDQLKKVTHVVYADRFYYAPVQQGDIVGKIRYYYNEIEVAHTDLIAENNIDVNSIRKKSFINKIKQFFLLHFRL